MLNSRQLPSMSTDECINDDLMKLNKIYCYFLASEHSQSNIYLGSISSLKYLFYLHNTEPDKLISEVTKTLTELINRYFNDTEAYVRLNDDGKVLLIDIKCTTDSGKSIKLTNTLELRDNTLDTYNAIKELMHN